MIVSLPEEEAAAEAARQYCGERRAESLSQDSYEAAINEYRALAEDGTIFEDAYGGPDPVSWGEKVADKLDMCTKKLAFGIVDFYLFSEVEHAVIYDALILPFNIHYTEFTYVGEGGNARTLIEAIERAQFEEEERWEGSEETDIRTTVVTALLKFCKSAAALAKHLGATPEQRKVIRALQLIRRYCDDGVEGGGMSKSEAALVCKWIMDANSALWAYSSAEAQLVKWFPKVPVPPLTPGQKRADELLAKSFTGEITQEEVDELMSVGKRDEELRDEGCGMRDVEGGMGDEEGTDEESDRFEPITPSEYAKSFIRVDNEKHIIYIKVLPAKPRGKTPPKPKETPFLFPDGYATGWKIMKLLIECDAPAGNYQFTEEQRNLSDGWRTLIYHGRGEHLHLKELIRYIHSARKSGRPTVEKECQGLCCLRISQTPKTQSGKKKSKKSSTK